MEDVTITATRRLTFSAGHRVAGHESKCANIHGHNFVAEIETAAPALDAVGRVIDFSVIKRDVGGWIDREWDHRFLLWEEDEHHTAMADLPGLVLLPFNPTAENLAAFLIQKGQELLSPFGILVVRVRIYETENCWVESSPDSMQVEILPGLVDRRAEIARTILDFPAGGKRTGGR